jgi:hypothetical protein
MNINWFYSQFDQLKDSVAENKIEEVIQYLTDYLKAQESNDLLNQVLLASSRYREWEKNRMNNLQSASDLSVEIQNIKYSLLKIIGLIEEKEVSNEKNKYPSLDNDTIKLIQIIEYRAPEVREYFLYEGDAPESVRKDFLEKFNDLTAKLIQAYTDSNLILAREIDHKIRDLIYRFDRLYNRDDNTWKSKLPQSLI